MAILERTLQSAVWTMAANAMVMVVAVTRTILLARLLPIEAFGIYAFAGAITAMVAIVARFGLDGAFLHRATETLHEEDAARVHFSLTLVLALLSAATLVVGAMLFAVDALQTALLVLATTHFGLHLTSTPRVILQRRVTHRRLAILQAMTTTASTCVAVILASQNMGLWSLLAIDVTACLLAYAALYAWRPVWRPRLLWRTDIVRYFLGFGVRNLMAQLLEAATQRVDKLWVGAVLGNVSLGFYARAYGYSQAPNAVFSDPVFRVVGGTYAALKKEPKRLAHAAYRVASLLFRGSCMFAGLAALLAPELIVFLIGEKWLPMVEPFRVLLAASIFKPVLTTLVQLAVAVGEPGALARVRLLQLLVLVGAMLALSPLFGILGVALAVLASSLAGLGLLLALSRRFVKLPLRRLFAAPLLTLAVAIAMGFIAPELLPPAASEWTKSGVKAVLFLSVYGVGLALIEGQEILSMARWTLGHLRGSNLLSTGRHPPALD